METCFSVSAVNYFFLNSIHAFLFDSKTIFWLPTVIECCLCLWLKIRFSLRRNIAIWNIYTKNKKWQHKTNLRIFNPSNSVASKRSGHRANLWIQPSRARSRVQSERKRFVNDEPVCRIRPLPVSHTGQFIKWKINFLLHAHTWPKKDLRRRSVGHLLNCRAEATPLTPPKHTQTHRTYRLALSTDALVKGKNLKWRGNSVHMHRKCLINNAH